MRPALLLRLALAAALAWVGLRLLRKGARS